MTIWTKPAENDYFESDEFTETDRFERFTYRSAGEAPVRSHASRTRGRMRSRASAAARQKAHSFNGANRRGSRRQAWSA